jgi:hypothetical protein
MHEQLGNTCPRPESYYYRAIENGYDVCVYKMLYSWRVCMSDEFTVVNAYCYPTFELAVAAAMTWDDPDDEPMVGWTKHPSSGRYRRDGDPKREERLR